MRHLFLFLLLTFVSFVTAQNVMISNQNSPYETAIKIDPKHPNVIIAGSNLDNYFVSIDTGKTWSSKILKSTYGVWGDPTIEVDTSGNFYYFHLSNMVGASWIDRIVCQKSTDNGSNWSNGTYTGLNGTKAQDKQWSTVDRKRDIMYLTWTQFDDYGSPLTKDSSIILFSKSINNGASWSTPKRISKFAGDCIDEDNTVEGAVPAVGPNGEVYVAWAGAKGLMFNKSLDQGETWLPQEIVIDPFIGGWDFNIPGINRSNGLPIVKCDLSNGPNRGTIYINWCDQSKGSDNTEVWCIKSIDGGKTWETKTKVNDDNSGKHQFFTWMDIDQTNGYLYFVFYDRRNYSNDSTDVYLALSKNGGKTYINKKVSETPFVPNEQIFMGDYTNISVYNGIVRPIWSRLNNGQHSIWTSIVNESDFGKAADVNEPTVANDLSFENYPNPTKDIQYVSYKLRDISKVNLTLYDNNGKIVSSIIQNEERNYGVYIEKISINDLDLPNGSYYLKLEINGVAKINRLVLIKE